jgi:hypothetical protein
MDRKQNALLTILKIKFNAMKAAQRVEYKRESRVGDYPELQVGFPERNDASSPNLDRERIHVDLDTLNISRTTEEEVTREVTGIAYNIK